jgi:hypothetical protein
MTALLFSLAFRPNLEVIYQELPQATLVAYLDDLYVLNAGTENPLQIVKTMLD